MLRQPHMVRLMDKVSVRANGCWVWVASLHEYTGYGQFKMDGVRKQAHRASYEMLVGPVPEGLELDHLCRNRACVNPDHLEPVTHAVNMARGSRAMKTECVHGHAYTNENTKIETNREGKFVKRICITCRRSRYPKVRARTPEEQAEDAAS